MPECLYCGDIISNKNDNGRTKSFCNKSHEQLWHTGNRGNNFTAFSGDTPDMVENRKARMREYCKYHTLACAGDKEARWYLRQILRLRAIWDNVNKKEVRL